MNKNVKVAQEEIADTLAGELDMHLEDMEEAGQNWVVEGYTPRVVVTGVDPHADGDTFYLTISTGQRFRVQVTEVTEVTE